MSSDCTMCGDEATGTERVGGETVSLCPACHSLLEQNGRLDEAAVAGGGD